MLLRVVEILTGAEKEDTWENYIVANPHLDDICLSINTLNLFFQMQIHLL